MLMVGDGDELIGSNNHTCKELIIIWLHIMTFTYLAFKYSVYEFMQFILKQKTQTQ